MMTMQIRLGKYVRLRSEKFGGIAYVPSRDDFFALDSKVFAFLQGLDVSEWRELGDDAFGVHELAGLQLIETLPPTAPRSYSGPSFIGHFDEIVSLEQPLVLNCFSTAHCPLACRYCHADDLMGNRRREAEDAAPDAGLANVIAAARRVPSLVAVITGGDPLTRFLRSKQLIRALSGQKALVFDTSGIASEETIREAIDELAAHNVHVRVSIDSASAALQTKIRPVNPRYYDGLDSLGSAQFFVEEALRRGLGVTVQSVVSQGYDTREHLLHLRDYLIKIGVRHWVLHLAVEAGKARAASAPIARRHERGAVRSRRTTVLPSPSALAAVWHVMKRTIRDDAPIDIRVTDNTNTPNSVLLLGSDGALYTEGLARRGKVTLFSPERDQPNEVERLFYYIDKFGHARRYLNWSRELFDGRDLRDLCLKVSVPELPTSASAIVERERKFSVADTDLLRSSLQETGFIRTSDDLIDDRYYDTPGRDLHANDFVVRLRSVNGAALIAMKGPRFRQRDGDISRIELELPTAMDDSLEAKLKSYGLDLTWRLERRRETFRKEGIAAVFVIDTLAEVGTFAEVEGAASAIAQVTASVAGLGRLETRNYQEIVLAWARSREIDPQSVLGVASDGVLRAGD